jgi:hypothetical protein
MGRCGSDTNSLTLPNVLRNLRAFPPFVSGERAKMSNQDREPLGLEIFLQRPSEHDANRIPDTRDAEGRVIYPELDADGDHVHFEMVPMGGDSLLWLTMRRGVSSALAAASLRKIADLLDRHGSQLLNEPFGYEGSFDTAGGVISGPLRLEYDEHGDLVIPDSP